MLMNIDVRSVKSDQAEEVYISASPVRQGAVQEQWREIFAGIREALVSSGASLLQERVFGTENALESAVQIRAKEHGEIDDGVQPCYLICKEGINGPVGGVQIHAVKCKNKPDLIEFENNLCGRVVRIPSRSYLTLSGISAPDFPNPEQQARAMFEKSEAILGQYSLDFFGVPRTWIWLGDILSWYGPFNKVRNDFFTERGMISEKESQSLPASTGIGLYPAGKASCSMDLLAVLEPSASIKYLPSAGRQQCAFEYGSAFSRATEAVTPAAKTVFISGTASIDIDGKTTNVGNPLGQVKETIENVRAVLRDMSCKDEDVVQVVAYCKNVEVEKIFCSLENKLAWPWVTVVCDICRPELLFEVEAAAIASG